MSHENVKNIHLTIELLSERLQGLSKSTLSNWRAFGKGPKFINCGRLILYPLVEVEKWEQDNLRSHTSEYLRPRK